jgi:hypothetical protein
MLFSINYGWPFTVSEIWGLMHRMAKQWKLVRRIAEMTSPWVTMYADMLQDDHGKHVEYWHVRRADSVIVIVIRDGQFLLPTDQYRPGIGVSTLDFAGGRIGDGQSVEMAALAIMHKELGVSLDAPMTCKPLTDGPLAVDSSFSSQRLYGLLVELPADVPIAASVRSHPVAEADALRRELHCAQCRVLLDEFLLQSS